MIAPSSSSKALRATRATLPLVLGPTLSMHTTTRASTSRQSTTRSVLLVNVRIQMRASLFQHDLSPPPVLQVQAIYNPPAGFFLNSTSKYTQPKPYKPRYTPSN